MIPQALLAALLSLPAATDPATELARTIHKNAGGDELSKVAELRFKFVVYNKDKKVMEAAHRWDLWQHKDRVTWTDRQGQKHDITVDIQTQKAAGGAEGGDKAYARWVNDSYWLMLPLKLLDPGVHREIETPRELHGKKYEILRLSFEGVGLTPGDVYWLYVDPKTKDIEYWMMKLQDEKGPPEGTSFADYRKVGPLRLALDHKSDDGGERIALEDVQALEKCDEHDFAP